MAREARLTMLGSSTYRRMKVLAARMRRSESGVDSSIARCGRDSLKHPNPTAAVCATRDYAAARKAAILELGAEADGRRKKNPKTKAKKEPPRKVKLLSNGRRSDPINRSFPLVLTRECYEQAPNI
jgi:hypothetical protein